MKMLKKKWGVALAVIFTAFIIVAVSITGRGGKEDNKVLAGPVLRVGSIPIMSSAQTRDQFEDFLLYLSKRTGCKTELVVTEDYNGIVEKMAHGELDIALFGPFSYIIAHEKAGAEAFAMENGNKSGAVYYSLIIVHPMSNINSLQELKGKRFAFTDQASTSGHLIPKAALIKNGIDIDRDLLDVEFAGNHDAAVLAVKKRTVDAAAVSSNVLDTMKNKGLVGSKDIKIIFTSEAIPSSVWTYRSDLPLDLKKKIENAFLNINPYDKSDLGEYGDNNTICGFLPAEDKDYHIIRETIKQLNLDYHNLK